MEFDPHHTPDYLSQAELSSLQLTLLNKHLNYLISRSPFYQKKLEGLASPVLSDLGDLRTLPTTSKQELSAYNADFLSIPRRDVVEYVTTSGSTGKPVSIALSRNDLRRLAYNESRALTIAGFTADDTVQLTATLDRCFVAGMAYYQGLTEIGAAVIRAGQGSPEFHLETIRQLQPTAMIGVPSFIDRLGRHARFADSGQKISRILCIGEPLRTPELTPNRLAQNLAMHWQADFLSTYASTEMATAFTECPARQGGHLLPELILVEILDADGQEVADGEPGEVTVTPFGVEAMPLLRFRTGDVARKHTSPCSCGRSTLRLGPIEGRLSQMIKYKGTTLFPTQLEEILLTEPKASQFVIVIDLDENGLDLVSVYLPDTMDSGELSGLSTAIQANLRVKPVLLTLPPGEIQQLLFRDNSRKPKKILDRRHAQN